MRRLSIILFLAAATSGCATPIGSRKTTPELSQKEAKAEQERAGIWAKLTTAEKIKYYATLPYYHVLPYLP